MGERQIINDDRRATVCLGWGAKTSHRQNFKFHTRSIIATSNISSFSLWCTLLSNGPLKHKLAVKYDIIKSSGFFDYEESMNYSEATNGNILLSILLLPSLSHRSVFSLLRPFSLAFSPYIFFFFISSLHPCPSLISILWEVSHYC